MKIAPVSVVIPTYNCGRWITQAVDSVLAQTVRPAEIVVVDDGSKDDTAERLKVYRDRIHYLHRENQGVAAARNIGVTATNKEWIAFLDADDVWHPRKLELQTDVLTRRHDLALLGTRFFFWPSEEFPILDDKLDRHVADVSWDRLVVKNYFATSAVVIRRVVLERVGLFDTMLQGPEDWDLWLRVAELAPVANLDLPLMGYRNVAGSVSHQADTCHDGMLRVLRKIDLRNCWGGQWLLRRKAYAVLNHDCSYVYGAANRHWAGIQTSLQSLLWYPLPLTRDETGSFLGRPRRLAVHVLRALRLKTSDTPYMSVLPDGRLDAVDRLKQSILEKAIS